MWKDGRTGVYNALLKGDAKQPVLVLTGATGTTSTGAPSNYDGLVAEIAQFFHTGKPPVDIADTLEIMQFMTAAQISKEKAQRRLQDVR